METNQTNEITFINLTGREINIYATDDCEKEINDDYERLVAKDGAKPIRVIPPSGTVAKDSQIRRQVTVLDGIPVNQTSIGKVEGLPRWRASTFYIVSPSIVAVETTRNDLLIVDSTVRDKNGNVIGCTSFGRFINPYV